MLPTTHARIAQIDGSSLIRQISRLASTGLTRLAYSQEDIEGRAAVKEMLKAAGLDIRTDEAGNIIARREGRKPHAPIAFGSHVDTVRNGGKYDGVLGVLAGIECVDALRTADYTTEHPLELIIFANEEGQVFDALCGSKAITGLLGPDDLGRTDGNSRTLADAIKDIGGDPAQIPAAARTKGDIAAFIELHIEQGGILDNSKIPIGIVEGITGITYTDVRIMGRANHSGTTIMELRRDALAAACELVLMVEKAALEGRCRVATVGKMTVTPNATNIIPGEVQLTIELRDLDAKHMADTLEYLHAYGDSIQEHRRVNVFFSDRSRINPVPCSNLVQKAIRESCIDLGLQYRMLPSGAGHDAQMMAALGPMGMIFVPSVAGVSHSPNEFTTDEDCVRGAEVLLHTILRLDTMLTDTTEVTR
ncbi:MAG: Zn-dependent hydrolase [Acidobacteriaceae bacterium]|nr:Zn-dependent hydrolase [Acidobacteriaceae bacterium]